MKSYPSRPKTPRSWCDQLDTTNVSQYLATQISGHSGYHVGPSLSAWYIIKLKNVSCEIEDFVATHLRKLRGILRWRILRVLCDLIKDASPYRGEQNLTAVEFRVCTSMWPCIYKHTYLDLAHFGGHARHILPPLSPSQPIIADEEIILLGNPPELICSLWRSFFRFLPVHNFVSFFYCLPERAFSFLFMLYSALEEEPSSPIFLFFRDIFLYVRRTSLYEHIVAEHHQIVCLLPPPYRKHRKHNTVQRSQPAQQAAKQARADQSATTQESRRSWITPACRRAYIIYT